MKKPNIILIQADQMAGPALPMYGHKVVKAPNLQKLAETGTTFKNAYSNNPVCAPSRFSMMSGQLSSRIGAFDNGSEFPAAVPTIAHYLRNLGYKTCLTGKMHFVGPDQLHGFEERLTTDIYPSDFGWTPDWSQTDFPFAPSVMSLRGVIEAGICKRSLQLDYDDEVSHTAIQKIYDFARDKDQDPFFLTVSFTHPHNPFTITQEYWDRYEHSAIDMPSVPYIPLEERDPWSQRYYHLIRQDEHHVSDETILTARHAYYGMISYVDDQVGKIIEVLQTTGLSKNSVIVFTSDHGDMMGERGMWFKFNPFEWSVRVPLIISIPGGAKGHLEERGVSLIDLMPTFLDLASEGNSPEVIDPIDGNSLVGLLHNTDPDWADDVMMEFTGEGIYSPCFMLRQSGFKYVYCEDDPAMLFDLNKDPGELNNLRGKADFQDIERSMLNTILKRWDGESIKQQIIRSQNRRKFLQKVLLTGKRSPWDYVPYRDASKEFVRSALDTSTTMTKGLARFPYLEPVPPHTPRTKNNKKNL